MEGVPGGLGGTPRLAGGTGVRSITKLEKIDLGKVVLKTVQDFFNLFFKFTLRITVLFYKNG